MGRRGVRAWLPGRAPSPAPGQGPVVVLGQLLALVAALLVASRVLGGACVDGAPSCAACALPPLDRPEPAHVGSREARLVRGASGGLELIGDDLPGPPADDARARLVLLAPGSAVDQASLAAQGLAGRAAAALEGLAAGSALAAAGLGADERPHALAGVVGRCPGRCLRTTAALLLTGEPPPAGDELLLFEGWEAGAWRGGRRILTAAQPDR